MTNQSEVLTVLMDGMTTPMKLPALLRGFNFSQIQMVDSALNINGSFIGSKIGNRRKWKLDGLEWNNLSEDDQSELYNIIEHFTGIVKFYHPRLKQFVYAKFYWGDDNLNPISYNRLGRMKRRGRFKCNIIDQFYPYITGLSW